MFALKDPSETADLLAGAGFRDVAVEPVSPTIVLGGGGTLDESLQFLLGSGMPRGLLSRVPEDRRDRAVGAIREELAARHEPGIGVRVGTGAWLVTARR